jgi:hypothetical protein
MQGTTSVGIFIGAFSDFANVASNIIQVAGGKGIDISNSLGGSVTGNNLDGATVGTDAINLNGQVAILVTGNRISRWTSSPAIVGDTSSDKIGMNLGSTVSRNFS